MLELIQFFIMIEFTPLMEQDFLNRKNAQKLIDAGIDMSDAKYFLFKRVGREYLGTKTECTFGNNAIPTLSITELFTRSGGVIPIDNLIKTFING